MTRSVLVLPALLLAMVGCAPASGPEAEAAVTAVLDTFYGAMKTGDTATAMSVIAPDALFVESGMLETREEYEQNQHHFHGSIADRAAPRGRLWRADAS